MQSAVGSIDTIERISTKWLARADCLLATTEEAMPPTIIRDLSDTSGYWAAVWTMCCMPDIHVICDAPIGCFNLVATAVPDYTDAIPHIENITPSVMTEQEVGGQGTGPAVKRTYEQLRDTGALAGKQVIVVSTAESEMIGSDLTDLVKQLQAGTEFYYSNSLSEDEWAGRDRVLRWLWQHYGAPHAAGAAGHIRGHDMRRRVAVVLGLSLAVALAGCTSTVTQTEAKPDAKAVPAAPDPEQIKRAAGVRRRG